MELFKLSGYEKNTPDDCADALYVYGVEAIRRAAGVCRAAAIRRIAAIGAAAAVGVTAA